MEIEIPEFDAPSWLNSQDATTIQRRMMENLPEGIDRTEGGFPWDLTKPTALEKAEALQFHMIQALKMMYSMWATGAWLDLHGLEVKLERKLRTKAEGTVTVKGNDGIIIPQGFIFATAATVTTESKRYQSIESAQIISGSVDIHVESVEAGAEYNTPEDTVVLMETPLGGITSITNCDVITGGADDETDDDYRKRIIEAERSGSFTGCDSDYVRWAKEVAGVSSVVYVNPLWNGPGTVQVLVADSNGNKVNEDVIERVYNHIVSPDDRSARLAPIGADVTVDSVKAFSIDIAYDFICKEGINADDIHTSFEDGVIKYFADEAVGNLQISYNRIRAIIEGIEGVVRLLYLDIVADGNQELAEAEIVKMPLGHYPELKSIERKVIEA